VFEENGCSSSSFLYSLTVSNDTVTRSVANTTKLIAVSSMRVGVRTFALPQDRHVRPSLVGFRATGPKGTMAAAFTILSALALHGGSAWSLPCPSDPFERRLRSLPPRFPGRSPIHQIEMRRAGDGGDADALINDS